MTRWRSSSCALVAIAFSLFLQSAKSHHLDAPALHFANERNSDKPLRVSNNCPETIYAAILTVSGSGPASSGFRLEHGDSNSQTVSADWRGRVWGRTNCSFNPDGTVPMSGQGGQACETGDCGYFVECFGAGNPPATLAEFTFNSPAGQTFYDLSLVDGYNLPLGIISLLQDVPPNLTNPVCIGTASLLAPIGDTSDTTFGTNSTYPLPLEQMVSNSFVQSWCPWPLLLDPPSKPNDGVYAYPDNNIHMPVFNPCFSTCAKYNQPQYCCTGQYNTADLCKPSFYSMQAKKVCPDAYTYAFDDQTSTFIIPSGGGFEIVFCPAGRSSNILNTFGREMRQITQSSHAGRNVVRAPQNANFTAERSEAYSVDPSPSLLALVVLLVWACISCP